jgi:hypothetical protein
MGKKAFIDTNIHSKMNEAELISDERIVYIYLITCPLRNLHGLYELNIMDIGYNCGLNKDRIPVILRVLNNNSLIYYSNRLVFVPEIPESENFKNRLSNEKMPLNKRSLIHAIQKYSNHRGETQEKNTAFEAFCDYFKNEIPFIIENVDVSLLEKNSLFANGSTTLEHPLYNGSTTLEQPLYNGSTTLEQPLQNGSTTVGRKSANPSTTLVQPLGEKVPTLVQPLGEKVPTLVQPLYNGSTTLAQQFNNPLPTL